MNHSDCIIRPRARLWGIPLSLGLTMSIAGGILTFVMVDAFDIREHWALSLATVLMGAGSLALFVAGVKMLAAAFERVRVSRTGLVVTLFGIPVRRIPADSIYSITATSNSVLVRNQEKDILRLLVNISGKGRQARRFWLDWSIDTEDALKTQLPHLNFLF